MSTTKTASAIIIMDENFDMLADGYTRGCCGPVTKIDWSSEKQKYEYEGKTWEKTDWQIHLDLTKSRFEIAGFIYHAIWYMYERRNEEGLSFYVKDSEGNRSICAWDAFGQDWTEENIRKVYVDEFLFKGVPTDEPDYLKQEKEELQAALDDADFDSLVEDDELED